MRVSQLSASQLVAHGLEGSLRRQNQNLVVAGRVAGLSKSLFHGLTSILTPIRIPLRALVSLLITC